MPIIASLILKGLPSSFDSFSSRSLITDLISEEARMGANADLNANKAFNNKGKYCDYCKGTNHIRESKEMV